MLDVEDGAQCIELVLTGRCAFAQAEEPIGELLSVVRKDGADAQRASGMEQLEKSE